MTKFTFKKSEVIGKHGNRYTLLSSNEYPWENCQVIPTPPEKRDEILAALKSRKDYVVFAEGRTDFCVIQAGGGPTIKITKENYKEVDKAICECVQAAADFWASEGESAKKERPLTIDNQ